MKVRKALVVLCALLVVSSVTTLRAGEKSNGQPAVEKVFIELENFRLLTYAQGKFLNSYPISIGKDTAPTPTGKFRITSMLKNPWYTPDDEPAQPPADENNPIGSRWLGINKPSYGIHGTNQPERMREKVSDGCIRMLNEHVNQLYERVSRGAVVVIREDFEADSFRQLAEQTEK